ncbi:MAG: hypothetical protein ACXVA2_15915 [Mucilaginibacter sp.]
MLNLDQVAMEITYFPIYPLNLNAKRSRDRITNDLIKEYRKSKDSQSQLMIALISSCYQQKRIFFALTKEKVKELAKKAGIGFDNNKYGQFLMLLDKSWVATKIAEPTKNGATPMELTVESIVNFAINSGIDLETQKAEILGFCLCEENESETMTVEEIVKPATQPKNVKTEENTGTEFLAWVPLSERTVNDCLQSHFNYSIPPHFTLDEIQQVLNHRFIKWISEQGIQGNDYKKFKNNLVQFLRQSYASVWAECAKHPADRLPNRSIVNEAIHALAKTRFKENDRVPKWNFKGEICKKFLSDINTALNKTYEAKTYQQIVV